MKHKYQNFWGKPKIGRGTKIGAYVEIGKGVVIGKNCKIQAFVFIPPGVEIGEDVFIGPRVCFTNDRNPNAWDKWRAQPTKVGNRAVIGAGAVILPVEIGECAIIGAGAVVTKDVPKGETWAGVPARKI